MAVLEIPTSTDPFYTQMTQLEGVNYELEFRYNQRESVWYFSIALDDGTVLASGIKIVCKVPLLRKRADLRLPPGILIALPNSEDDTPPNVDELGIDRRVTLTYFERSSIP